MTTLLRNNGNYYVGLSSERTSITPKIGLLFFETDTGSLYFYDGIAWSLLVKSGVTLPPGGGITIQNFRFVTGSGNIFQADSIIYCPTATPITLTLPQNNVAGQIFTIVNYVTSLANVTVNAGTATIDGAASATVTPGNKLVVQNISFSTYYTIR